MPPKRNRRLQPISSPTANVAAAARPPPRPAFDAKKHKIAAKARTLLLQMIRHLESMPDAAPTPFAPLFAKLLDTLEAKPTDAAVVGTVYQNIGIFLHNVRRHKDAVAVVRNAVLVLAKQRKHTAATRKKMTQCRILEIKASVAHACAARTIPAATEALARLVPVATQLVDNIDKHDQTCELHLEMALLYTQLAILRCFQAASTPHTPDQGAGDAVAHAIRHFASVLTTNTTKVAEKAIKHIRLLFLLTDLLGWGHCATALLRLLLSVCGGDNETPLRAIASVFAIPSPQCCEPRLLTHLGRTRTHLGRMHAAADAYRTAHSLLWNKDTKDVCRERYPFALAYLEFATLAGAACLDVHVVEPCVDLVQQHLTQEEAKLKEGNNSREVFEQVAKCKLALAWGLARHGNVVGASVLASSVVSISLSLLRAVSGKTSDSSEGSSLHLRPADAMTLSGGGKTAVPSSAVYAQLSLASMFAQGLTLLGSLYEAQGRARLAAYYWGKGRELGSVLHLPNISARFSLCLSYLEFNRASFDDFAVYAKELEQVWGTHGGGVLSLIDDIEFDLTKEYKDKDGRMQWLPSIAVLEEHSATEDASDMETLLGRVATLPVRAPVSTFMEPLDAVATLKDAHGAIARAQELMKEGSIPSLRNAYDGLHEAAQRAVAVQNAYLYKNVCRLWFDVCCTLGDCDASAALILNESLGVTLRHEILASGGHTTVVERKGDVDALVKGVGSMQLAATTPSIVDMVRVSPLSFSKDELAHVAGALPNTWAVVSIAVSADRRRLLISRIHHGVAMNLALPFDPQSYASIVERFASIMKRSKVSAHATSGLTTSKQKRGWWDRRFALDKELGQLLQDMEHGWLGAWRGVLLGAPRDSSNLEPKAVALAEEMARVTRASTTGLLPYARVLLLSEGREPCVERDVVEAALSRLCAIYTKDPVPTDAMQRMMDLLSDVSMGAGEPVILILSKEVQQLPWENMPIACAESMTRMPSLAVLRAHVAVAEERSFDASNGFYVLNPGNDLPATERSFRTQFEAEEGWQGITGEAPTLHTVRKALSERDLYVYCGHGTGEQYVRADALMKNFSLLGEALSADAAGPRMRPVVLLMGCSSGLLKGALESRYEVFGMALAYLASGCPAVVANLWDVTDKDIDRYSHALLDTLRQRDEAILLPHSVGKAREACKLRYLIGASPVCYGLPVHFRGGEAIPTSRRVTRSTRRKKR